MSLTNLHRARSSESMRSKSFSSLEINPLEKAASLAEAAEKLGQSRKTDDALTLYESAIEEILEYSKVELDLDTVVRYHFAVAGYAKRIVLLIKQRETRELDLAEILNSSPQQAAPFTKESLESEVFLFKIQLKMKLTAELKKTRTYKSKQYTNSFSGSDAVLWLLNNDIVSNKEDAVNVGQALVDACLITHVDETQPFVDGPRLYRFVDRELYYLQLAMKNSSTGLPSLQSDVPPTPSSKKSKQRRFSGKEISDWLEKKDVLRLVERSEANRLGQRLVENYHLKDPENPMGIIFQDSDEVFYIFTHESESVSSLHTATQKGLLSFTTDGSKWKIRYFVLMSAQKLLYYFEAEDSPKPKGVLNLNAISLHQLDESMFNKKFCFQIISHEGTVSFAPPSEEIREQWMNLLFPLTIESTTLKEEETTQLSSFHMFIEEAEDLPADKNYFCVIFFGSSSGASVARTQVQWKCKNGAPNWSEQFNIDDLPSNVNEITVGVFSQKSTREGDRSLVGFVTIKLASLSSHVENYAWYPFSSGTGKLRLRFSLEEELILPLKAYKSLLDLSTSNFEIPRTLLNLTSSLDREHFAQTVLRILEAKNKAFDFLLSLIRADVEGTNEAAVLFRVNTVGTKAVVEYMKMVAQSYVSSVLHSPLQAIITSGVKVEEGANLTPELRDDLNAVLGSIFSSVNHMPIQLKRLFSEIRKMCVNRFPNDPNIGNLSVSGFLFLRFLCPALVTPASFGILEDVPDDASRVFKLLARLVQYLANLKLDHSQQTDPAIKECLEENTPKMKAFLESASDSSNEGHFVDISFSIDLERELAYYYHYLVNQSNDMIEKTSQSTRDALSDIMDEISAKYEEKWPNRSMPYQYKISLAKAAMFLS